MSDVAVRPIQTDDHEAWPLEARYIAAGLANLTLVLSPERIVVGGASAIGSGRSNPR